MQPLHVSDQGWLAEARKLMTDHKDFAVSISGEEAVLIHRRIQMLTNQLPLMGLWEKLGKIIPAVGNIPVDPTAMVPILAGIGAVSAATGSMAFAAVAAVQHGYKAKFTYTMGDDLYDPGDDVFTIELTAPKE